MPRSILVVYDQFGQVRITRGKDVAKLDLPIKRAKGSGGNISVMWSVVHNTSGSPAPVWPASGAIYLREGQWNSSITVTVANDETVMPEQVVWVELGATTGGAVLATRDQTRTKIIIASNVREGAPETEGLPLATIIGSSAGGAILLVLLLVLLVRLTKHVRKATQMYVSFFAGR